MRSFAARGTAAKLAPPALRAICDAAAGMGTRHSAAGSSRLLSLMHHQVTTAMMMAAPISANIPGISPTKIATQTGLNKGSSIPMREQASGGQLREATV